MTTILCWRTAPIVCLALLAFTLRLQAADDKPAEKETREAVGKLASPAGSLLDRKEKDAAWTVVPSKGDVFSTDSLLALPGARAQIDNANRTVRLTLWGNLPEFSSYPLLESEVVLHKSANTDLDFTLKRGRVVVARTGGDKNPVRVRVRFGAKEPYDLLLAEGAEVALEKYARWPSGTQFLARPPRGRVPHVMLVVLAIKGKADLKIEDEQYLLSAPATFQWDNVGGRDAKPNRAKGIPTWVAGIPDTPEAKQMSAAVERLQKLLETKPPAKALPEQLASANAADRKLAVYAYGAFDDLSSLAEALSDEKRPEVRADGITALRHWLGQAPENDVRLYDFLVKKWDYAPAQAEIVAQLLLGFRDADRDRPETYETLIEYLRHKKRSIRELAHWHLYHWVIAGRNIPYDAAASADERERAYQAWKKLIPDGKLPPAAPKPDGK
jgi:hypothetical protein